MGSSDTYLGLILLVIVGLGLLAFMIVTMWKLFEKAGRAG